jgi:hypothetical protein
MKNSVAGKRAHGTKAPIRSRPCSTHFRPKKNWRIVVLGIHDLRIARISHTQVHTRKPWLGCIPALLPDARQIHNRERRRRELFDPARQTEFFRLKPFCGVSDAGYKSAVSLVLSCHERSRWQLHDGVASSSCVTRLVGGCA